MPEPIEPVNGDMPQTITPEQRQDIAGYIQAIGVNPSLGPLILGKWRRWKHGQIVAPGSVDDRMFRAFAEGVNVGVQVATTAIVLAQWEKEKRAEAEKKPEEVEGEPK